VSVPPPSPTAAAATATLRSAPRRAAARARGVLPEGRRGPAVLARDALFRRSLAAADVSSAALAVVVGVAWLGSDRLTPTLLLALPLVILVSKLVGLYDRDEHLLRKTTLEEAPAVFQVAALYSLLLWLAGGYLVQGELGRSQVLALWALLLVSMLLARALARRLARGIAPDERCLVLGDLASYERLRGKFHQSHGLPATLVGRVPLVDRPGRRFGGHVLGSLDTLGLTLAEHDVQRVIIAPNTSDSDEILDAIRLVKALGVKVSVLPRLFEVVGSSARFDDVDGMTLLAVPSYGLSTSSYALKRAMDLVGTTVGLLLLAPLLLTIAAVVKLTSAGPVLYRQTRIGREGREFRMLKFRSMVERAEEQQAGLLDLNEADGLFKIADDPRLTRVGRVLRRFSLDELPQLLNVLHGEMSLVGPRPLVPDEDRRVEGWQRRRLHVPPGMTGVWQILGSARIPLQEMVKIDYLYGANWSLWLDVKILLRTSLYIFGRRGL